MTPPPTHSVLHTGRLVAYVWAGEAGSLRRGVNGEVLCEIAFADIVSFDRGRDSLLVELAAKSGELEAFVFKLGLEGFEVVDGAAEPSAGNRQF